VENKNQYFCIDDNNEEDFEIDGSLKIPQEREKMANYEGKK
jgi:hypothetical protein